MFQPQRGWMSNNAYVTNIFKKNFKSDKTVVVNRGGARSTKSYSIRQLFLHRLTNETNKNFLITRKTTPALKNTEYRYFIKLLKDYGYYKYCHHNKTDKTLEYNNNYMLFTSIDDPNKIKSTGFNYIWPEEANEFTYDDYMILQSRLSGQQDYITKESYDAVLLKPGEDRRERLNQIILTLNPTDAFIWIKTKVLDVDDDSQEIVSTYLDNPFLSARYVKRLEATKEQNPSWWKIYGEGEWGVLENIVYSNWKVEPTIPDCQEIIYGMDFGFNDPTAIVEIRVSDGEFFIRQRLLKTGWHNGDLIKWLRQSNISKDACIYADNAEPARIQEIYNAGYNIYPANKSVNDGIDFCKRKTLYIHSGSDDLIKEIRAYSHRKDKDGRVLEEPVKFNNHLMDAMRYGIYTHFADLEGKTSVWSV